MLKKMLIDASKAEETRVAVLQDDQLIDFDFEEEGKKPLKGNVYLGKIVRIEPSLQAAFVNYGRNRHGFLAFTEIHPDYFRIPVADRQEGLTLPQESEAEREGQTTEYDVQDFVEKVDETIPSEDPDLPAEEDQDEEEVKKKFSLYRNYKIQEVIQSRQVVLVQVLKEERGNKGAALTTFISLAGRYSVLMPNALNAGGISRKITDVEHRKRLKTLIKDLGMPEGMSLIIRTAGLNRTKVEIKRDYSYLIKLWADIREQTLQATAPALIYEDGNLIRRALRDIYTPEIEEIWIEGDAGLKEAKSFMKLIMPSQAKKIKHYKDASVTLFHQHKIEQQIEQIYVPCVKLPSGGYIVVNVTEALVAVDVNSGQATRERHIESTALKTNLEAAEEIARQVRLRDLAGLLVIDFIDMSDVKHNIAVERKLKESVASDRARIQIGRISQFGLLEMSRQRLRPSVIEAVSEKCSYCMGTGLTRAKSSLCLQLLRVLEEIALAKEGERLTVRLSSDLAFHLLSTQRKELFDLEQRRGAFFDIQRDELLGTIGFCIEDSQGNFLVDSIGAKKEPGVEHTQGSFRESGKTSGSKKKKNRRKSAKKDQEPEKEIKENKELTQPEDASDEVAEEAQAPRESSSKKRRRKRKKDKTVSENSVEPGNRALEVSQEVDGELPGDVNGNVLVEPSPGASEKSGPEKKKGARKKWWKKILDN